jgi:hypothetical protein
MKLSNGGNAYGTNEKSDNAICTENSIWQYKGGKSDNSASTRGTTPFYSMTVVAKLPIPS